MAPHDQLFKDLLRTFFLDFLFIADSGLAARLAADLGPGDITFLDKEMFLDQPEGKRREADLVAEVPRRSDGRKLLIQVEIEHQYRSETGRRLWRYSNQLYQRYEQPVVSIVVYLQGGPPGGHWVVWAEHALDQEIHHFRYLSFGVSKLLAEGLLARPQPLAWALASLARPGKIGRVRLKLELLRKIAMAPNREIDRFLLTNCVETYLQLEGREAEEYAAIRSTQNNSEIEAMEMTWADRIGEEVGAQYLQKGLEQGRKEGREEGAVRLRSTLLRLLGKRFGKLSPAFRARIEAIGSLEELAGLVDRVLEVRSVEELGLGR